MLSQAAWLKRRRCHVACQNMLSFQQWVHQLAVPNTGCATPGRTSAGDNSNLQLMTSQLCKPRCAIQNNTAA
eukprot:445906-Amphidinium_carterae.1